MADTSKVTIFVVGPSKVGKTAICNYIAELSDSINSSEYHPTQGVRILEFDRKIVSDGKTHKWKELNLEVELWDCSGDSEPDLFPAIKSNQCAVFAHRLVNSSSKSKVKMTHKTLIKAPLFYTSLDQDPEAIRDGFDLLLINVYAAMMETKEKEEKSIAG
ncbi:hypothetical protein BATDEDRAFT_89908 [Batrachochytrium dendrobatidis JAM81]|uniref:Uncharacterized protein n=1 Tax=Batrachochytrium dendrobatidis (strain JAM81 / FGSC 10211) TaxID=684364 RepID=F4P5X4_BATDJ|nr:uncharacterized protein BATDEDRAFT_89908 [Batrachochytrium dendrobatidis JAM81]EGF79253.1 hypothetical protein BATDEDRAFT_89908 [Batrachochytrium dendrobatidis JAM81]|eukprot:XP_006680075.1 hypothetical protein BATDEDRAFT_89908 [Batrachochytrium dendrobatidis JAM81]